MKKRIRREILIETEQIAFLKKETSKSFLKCEICETNSLMIKPEIIARELKISIRQIYRLIEANEVHFVEFEEQEVFVCLESLRTGAGSDPA